MSEIKNAFHQTVSPVVGAGGCAGLQVDPLIGLYIRIYMYEQNGVGWAEIREVL